MITLRLEEAPKVPLEAEAISPDRMAALSNAAIRELPVLLGKRACRIADFFEVDGEASEAITVVGDCTRVKWIGRAMTRGSITVWGNAGMHLGAYMSGGSIDVSGNASDWVGGEMSGGLFRGAGNVGGQIGAAYRGSSTGMRDGIILIGGRAGLEVGMRMKRGIIAVKGLVRDFAGLQMKGGTIILGGGAELRTGAWMMRGTIISLRPISLLPTFSYAATYMPSFLRLYASRLKELGFSLPSDPAEGAYRRYTGDTSVPGRGELLVWSPPGA